MKLQSFLQKTWQCAETMAKNPSIRNAVQGSSEFQEFQEYMRRSISAPVNLQSSQMEQIEGGPAGPVRRVHSGSPPEHESMSEGETSPEEGDPFMILLRQLIAMPVSVIYKALSWFFPLSQLEEEGEQLKEGGEDNSMVYTTLLTACLMIILFYKKFRWKNSIFSGAKTRFHFLTRFLFPKGNTSTCAPKLKREQIFEFQFTIQTSLSLMMPNIWGWPRYLLMFFSCKWWHVFIYVTQSFSVIIRHFF